MRKLISKVILIAAFMTTMLPAQLLASNYTGFIELLRLYHDDLSSAIYYKDKVYIKVTNPGNVNQKAACSTDSTYSYVLDISTPSGMIIYASLLKAFVAGRELILYGINDANPCKYNSTLDTLGVAVIK